MSKVMKHLNAEKENVGRFSEAMKKIYIVQEVKEED